MECSTGNCESQPIVIENIINSGDGGLGGEGGNGGSGGLGGEGGLVVENCVLHLSFGSGGLVKWWIRRWWRRWCRRLEFCYLR